MTKIRAIIADDHPIFRMGMQTMLSRFDDIEVVAVAEDGKKAVEAASAMTPDIILLDIIMPNMDGIEAAKIILGSIPTTKVLMLSSDTTLSTLESLIEMNISGFISKKSSVDEIAAAIRSVCDDQPYYGADVASLIERIHTAKKPSDDLFTQRELDVINLCCDGLISKQIADKLGIATKTVENIKASVFHKLGINSTVELVRYAFKNGLLSL